MWGKKISSLRVDHIDINFPEKIFNAFDTRETSIPIGHYTNYFVEPTCGLATLSGFIGPVDEPKFLWTRIEWMVGFSGSRKALLNTSHPISFLQMRN